MYVNMSILLKLIVDNETYSFYKDAGFIGFGGSFYIAHIKNNKDLYSNIRNEEPMEISKKTMNRLENIYKMRLENKKTEFPDISDIGRDSKKFNL